MRTELITPTIVSLSLALYIRAHACVGQAPKIKDHRTTLCAGWIVVLAPVPLRLEHLNYMLCRCEGRCSHECNVSSKVKI